MPKGFVFDSTAARVLLALDRKGAAKMDLGFATHLTPTALDTALSGLRDKKYVVVDEGFAGLVQLTDAGWRARNLAVHGVRPSGTEGDLPDFAEIDAALRHRLGID